MLKYLLVITLMPVFTLIIEYPIIRLSFGKKDQIFTNTLLINFITNIILNSTIIFADIHNELIIIAMEICVVIAETFMFRYCYKDIKWSRLWLTIFISNAISYGLSRLLL